MHDRDEHISWYLDEVGALLYRLPHQPIHDAIDALLTAYSYGRTIYVIGNGGSAATASHFAATCRNGRWLQAGHASKLSRLPTTSRCSQPSRTTTDTKRCSSSQLRTLLNPGDVVVAISGSGRSPNVVRAVQYAAGRGAVTVALTGMGGGELLSLADHCVVVPSDRMNQIEDVHTTLCHLMADAIKETVAESSSVVRSLPSVVSRAVEPVENAN